MEKLSFLKMFIVSIFVSMSVLYACSEEEAAVELVSVSDADLLKMAKNTSGFTWFKKSEVLLAKSTASGHSYPLLRTRFNAVAAKQLDAAGRINAGATFEEGSLIVKELYTDANTLSRYAVLYKKANTKETDAKGWIWGYIDANGTVAAPAAAKGSGCISCHTTTGSIDYMLMNKYFE